MFLHHLATLPTTPKFKLTKVDFYPRKRPTLLYTVGTEPAARHSCPPFSLFRQDSQQAVHSDQPVNEGGYILRSEWFV